MAKAKNSITVKVTKKHITKGTCGDSKKCAIAQAFVDMGFDSASVDGETAELTKKVKVGKATVLARFITYLPKVAVNFINKFDDAVDISDKLKLKPLSFSTALLGAEY